MNEVDRLAFLEGQLAALKEAHSALGDEFESDAAYFDVAIRNAKATAARNLKEQRQ